MGTGLTWLLVAALAGVTPADAAPARLRLARSVDGLEFRDAGLFTTHAAAPSLLRLSNGRLLALFSRQPDGELCVCQSRDGGASWSGVQPIRLEGIAHRGLRATQGALVQVSPRVVRAYFVARRPDGGPGESDGAFIASAVTRDGLNYEMDWRFRVDTRGLEPSRLAVLKAGSVIHMFVSSGPVGRAHQGPGALMHLISTDARRFCPTPDVLPAAAVGSVIELQAGAMRLFAWDDEGIVSLATLEGREWKPESGMRLAWGAEPAVATLADRSFLMVYAASTLHSPGETALLESSGSRVPGENTPDTGLTEAQPETAAPAAADWQAFAAEGPEDPAEGAWDADAAATAEPVLPPVADLIAPAPDGEHLFDYETWLRQRLPVPGEGNAYDAYAQFLHTPDDAGQPKPGWPDKIENMFTGEYGGAPFGWDPAQYPHWEASNQRMQNLLESFRQASLLDEYVDPLKFSNAQVAEASGGRPLLMEVLLPSLADHRQLARATLADAWRAENGQVDPERMLTGVETVLRAGSHFQQGPTLIHRLVGVAEQAAAEVTARQALAQVPFSAEQLEAGLQILQECDRGPVDPAGFVVGESAMAMEIMQKLLNPPPPSVNDLLAVVGLKLPGSGADSSPPDPLAEFRRFGLADVRESTEVFHQYYPKLAEHFRAGYPQVTRQDVQELADQCMKTSLAKQFIPSFDRVYAIHARSEAGRRGTQLTWAVHLFHARHGRWPSSLDELPADGSKMRTDPFSGRDFVYRITPSGPTIYSTSENGTDDGGRHSGGWGDEESVKTAGGSDDFVFWPAQ